jgi:MbtH protein
MYQPDEELAVVVNDEEQYSVWPVRKEIPAGWRDTGFRGTEEECLKEIDRVWKDITPASVRRNRNVSQ